MQGLTTRRPRGRRRHRVVVHGCRRRRGEGDRARDQPRRQGGRVLHQGHAWPATRPGSSRLEFVHFACTSEDINNLAYALLCAGARRGAAAAPRRAARRPCAPWRTRTPQDAMLSRTHGQPATPTTLGKEVAVFVHRLRRACDQFARGPHPRQDERRGRQLQRAPRGLPGRRLAGARRDGWSSRWASSGTPTPRRSSRTTGWPSTATPSRASTRSCIDLCRDFWGYISLGYFRQKVVAGEVGSSTMPHKVNPIDFENAEGNFGVANALLRFMAEKLPVSRWQRDLTDSTVLRNIGVALAHSDIAIQSVSRGLARLEVDRARLAADLDANWELLAEPIQTVMRRHAVPEAYEQLKALTRGRRTRRRRRRAIHRRPADPAGREAAPARADAGDLHRPGRAAGARCLSAALPRHVHGASRARWQARPRRARCACGCGCSSRNRASPKSEEMDDTDPTCRHALAYTRGGRAGGHRSAGTLPARSGAIAVLPEYRGTGVGSRNRCPSREPGHRTGTSRRYTFTRRPTPWLLRAAGLPGRRADIRRGRHPAPAHAPRDRRK